MGKAGVRGIRLNLATGGTNDPRSAAPALPGGAPSAWQAAAGTCKSSPTSAMISASGSRSSASPVPVVFDHFGGAKAALGAEQPGFADLVELVTFGQGLRQDFRRLSRSQRRRRIIADVAPLAKALIAANADRIVWGTDWPHPDSTTPPGGKATDVTPLMQIDDGRLLNQLPVWAPDAATRKKILVDNPARLYQF